MLMSRNVEPLRPSKYISSSAPLGLLCEGRLRRKLYGILTQWFPLFSFLGSPPFLLGGPPFWTLHGDYPMVEYREGKRPIMCATRLHCERATLRSALPIRMVPIARWMLLHVWGAGLRFRDACGCVRASCSPVKAPSVASCILW